MTEQQRAVINRIELFSEVLREGAALASICLFIAFVLTGAVLFEGVQ